MSYVAVVLSDSDQAKLRALAISWGLAAHVDKFLCHHLTLKFPSNGEGFNIGEKRELTVRGFGFIEGRVAAFWVLGAPESTNAVPHVTIGVNSKIGAKPVESNKISNWTTCAMFTITGTIEVCK